MSEIWKKLSDANEKLRDLQEDYKRLKRASTDVFSQQQRFFLCNENVLEITAIYEGGKLNLQVCEIIKDVRHVLMEVSAAEALMHQTSLERLATLHQ